MDDKRTALNAALTFLGLNDVVILDPKSLLYEAMIAVATGSLDKARLASVLEQLAVRKLYPEVQSKV